MQFNALDFVLIGIFAVLCLRGIIRGLIDSVFGLGSFIVAVYAAIRWWSSVAKAIRPMNEILLFLISFFSVFIIAYVMMKILQLIVKSIFSGNILKSLDRTLGFILGAVQGVILVFIVLILLEDFSDMLHSEKLLEESVIYNFVDKNFHVFEDKVMELKNNV